MSTDSGPNDPIAEAVKSKLESDGKIPAIKLYRKLKHAGLAEAKAYVDRLEGKSPSGPHRSWNRTRISPLAVVSVIVAVALMFVILYFLAR